MTRINVLGGVSSGGTGGGGTPVAEAPLAGLQSWRTALGGRAVAPADLLFLGDSVTEGNGATTRSRIWPQRLLDDLRRQYGVTGGVGYVPCASYQHTFTPPWTLTGGARTLYGLGGRGVSLTAAGHTVVTTQTCTSFSIFYLQGNPAAGTFTISIDGGAATTITPTTTGGWVPAKWTSGALAATAHTVTITYGNAGGTAHVLGGFFYNGDETTGIRMIDAAHYGFSSPQYAYDYADRVTDNNFECSQYALLPAPPAAVVIAIGLNDYDGVDGAAPGPFQTNVQTVIATIKAIHTARGWPPPSFVLVAMYQRTDITSPPYPWTAYVAALRAIAAADPTNVVVTSMVDRIDTTTQAFGILQADGVHPNDKGHGFIGEAIASTLFAA